jgi:iron complex transport system ATP-binding protein
MQIARNLADSGGVVVAILHDLNLAAMYADRIGMMRDGELWSMGTPYEVLTAENIHAVFNLPVHIMTHPHQDCPLIVPLIPDLTPQTEASKTTP